MAKRTIAIPGVISLAAVLALLWWGVPRSAADPLVLVDKQETGFRYTIIDDAQEQAVRIVVDYNSDTVDGVMGYKNAVAQRSASYATSNSDRRLEVDVTLNGPMSLEQFKQFTQMYDFQPKDFVIRTIAPDGQRGTISGALTPGEVISQETLDRLLTSQPDPAAPSQGDASMLDPTSPSSRMRGVVAFRGSLLGSNYGVVAADTRVVLVDAVESELKDEALTLRPAADRSRVQYTPKNPYWYMEELGLLRPPTQ